MEKEQDKKPAPVSDEALDEAAGGTVTFGGSMTGDAAAPGFQGGVSITDGTSNKAGYGAGFAGGVTVAAGDVNGDAAAKKIADGSVKPVG